MQNFIEIGEEILKKTDTKKCKNKIGQLASLSTKSQIIKPKNDLKMYAQFTLDDLFSRLKA